jgi:hypothetical protein
MAILFRPFGFIAPKNVIYLAFQSFDYETYRVKVNEMYRVKVNEMYRVKVNNKSHHIFLFFMIFTFY